MKQKTRMRLLFFIVSILSILAFPYNPLVIFRVVEPNDIRALSYIGWVFWVSGIILLFLSFYHIYIRRVKALINVGIYSVVRHPMYLGWILGLFIATIFLYQHWLFVAIGIPGIVGLYLISKEEEQLNIDLFGNEYRQYMQKVPGMNLLAGIIRHFRNRKEVL